MKLYDELAHWWTAMSPPFEYAEEAAFYGNVLQQTVSGPIDAVLELGSGGGSNAFHLKRRYREMVLVDASAGMLAVSRGLNPDLAHRQGDMRHVRLGRQFDAVFVHDAICYMTSEADLRATFRTAWIHCRTGGAALFCPDYVRENFQPGTDHGGHDEGNRGMRWLEWRSDPDPADTTYHVDYAYLLRDAKGDVRVEHDQHVEGLFARNDWLTWLRAEGFEPRMVPLELSEIETQTLEVFVAVKP